MQKQESYKTMHSLIVNGKNQFTYTNSTHKISSPWLKVVVTISQDSSGRIWLTMRSVYAESSLIAVTYSVAIETDCDEVHSFSQSGIV